MRWLVVLLLAIPRQTKTGKYKVWIEIGRGEVHGKWKRKQGLGA